MALVNDLGVLIVLGWEGCFGVRPPFLSFPYLFYPILIFTLSHPIQIYAAAFTTLKLGPIPYPIPSYSVILYSFQPILQFRIH